MKVIFLSASSCAARFQIYINFARLSCNSNDTDARDDKLTGCQTSEWTKTNRNRIRRRTAVVPKVQEESPGQNG